MDVRRVLGLLAAYLRRAGHPSALAGAAALNAYGLSRATADLDLVVPRAAQDGLVAELEGLGYETLHRSDGYSNHLHPDPTLGRVDLIYVDEPTAGKLFGEARAVPSGDAEGTLLPRPEHLIAMKVHAIRNDPSRRFRDLADVEFLLQRGDVDRDAVRRYFAEAGLQGDWDELQRPR